LLDIEIESKFLSNAEKREIRKERRRNKTAPKTANMSLVDINPMTKNQMLAFDEFELDKNLLLNGCAGTGKTFISLYLALKSIASNKNDIHKVTIVRSIVPTRDVGFLPGDLTKKTDLYESPYMAMCSELFSRGDAYAILKQKAVLEFLPTSYIRGITISDSIVIVDEMQNLNYHELDSIITRMGENSRIIFCGDFNQSDLIKKSEKNGILDFMKILDRMKSFSRIEFIKDDIVRSGLVREYIIAKEKISQH